MQIQYEANLHSNFLFWRGCSFSKFDLHFSHVYDFLFSHFQTYFYLSEHLSNVVFYFVTVTYPMQFLPFVRAWYYYFLTSRPFLVTLESLRTLCR